MGGKKVSIILPTYNGAKFIKDSIESVINQTYRNWELIIVNDGSTDNTLSICNEYALKDSRIHVISNSVNKKLPASLNIGFKEAKGEYFSWTSDDNMYKETAIEKMADFLDKNTDIGLISFDYDEISEDGLFLKTRFAGLKRNYLDLVHYCNIGACFMYRREIAQKVGEYDETMFCAEDYDYWCRIALAGTISYEEEALYLYRLNSSSLTAKKQDIINQKSLKIRLKYTIPLIKKGSLTEKEKFELLLSNYSKEKHKEWLDLAKQINLKMAFFLFNKNSVK